MNQQVHHAVPSEVAERDELEALIAAQHEDDRSTLVWPEFRDTVSLDDPIGEDEAGTLGDLLGHDPWADDAGEREVALRRSHRPIRRPKLKPHAVNAFGESKPGYECAKPMSWAGRLSDDGRAQLIGVLRESLAYFRRVTAFEFRAGSGNRPRGEREVLAAWLWQASLMDIPREMLEAVTGRSQQSISELIGEHQRVRAAEVKPPRLETKSLGWIPSSVLEDGFWRYHLRWRPGRTADGRPTFVRETDVVLEVSASGTILRETISRATSGAPQPASETGAAKGGRDEPALAPTSIPIPKTTSQPLEKACR